MNKKVLLSMGILSLTAISLHWMHSASHESQLRQHFSAYKTKYSKNYASLSELEYRMQIFQKSLDIIGSINSDPTRTFKAAINKFSDMTFDEFKSTYLMKVTKATDFSFQEELIMPKISAVDWREKTDAVSPIKDQKKCGSCWAFSTVASLEHAIWRKTKQSLSLSEQELVDCARRNYENFGCFGGFMDEGLRYIIENNISTEEAYPYTATDNLCDKDAKSKAKNVAVESYTYVRPGINSLLRAGAEQVVSIAFEFQDDLRFYEEGVYTPEDLKCGAEINHAVALVGYDSTAEIPYFIVKNSYGNDWGDQGFFKIAIGSGTGTCGIANGLINVYPTL